MLTMAMMTAMISMTASWSRRKEGSGTALQQP
jgi:hypothetical protein